MEKAPTCEERQGMEEHGQQNERSGSDLNPRSASDNGRGIGGTYLEQTGRDNRGPRGEDLVSGGDDQQYDPNHKRCDGLWR